MTHDPGLFAFLKILPEAEKLILYPFSAGSEDRAMLGSNPSAAAGDEGMRAGAVRLYPPLPHAFVFNAVNPGGTGGWPP